MIEITSPKSSYIKPYLSESYMLRWTIGCDDPDITPTQTAYEVMYRVKGEAAWSTCGKTESDVSEFNMGYITFYKTSGKYFVEIEYKLHVWMNWSRGEYYSVSGDAYSNVYEIIACSHNAKDGEYVGVYDGTKTQRYPVFDEMGTAGIEHIQINTGNNKVKNLPIVDESHPLAGNLKIKTNNGIKAAAGETAKFPEVSETRNGNFECTYMYGYFQVQTGFGYYAGYLGTDMYGRYFNPPFGAYGYVKSYSYVSPDGQAGGNGTEWENSSQCNYFYAMPIFYGSGGGPGYSYSYTGYTSLHNAAIPHQYQYGAPVTVYGTKYAYAYGYYLQYGEGTYTPTYTPPTYTPSGTYGYYSYISGYYSYSYQTSGGAGTYTYYTTSPVYGPYISGYSAVYGPKTGYGTYSYYLRYRTTSYNATGYGSELAYGYKQNGYSLGYYTYGYGTGIRYGTYGIPKYEQYSYYQKYSYTYQEWNHAYTATGYYSYTYNAVTGYQNTYGYKITGYTSNGPLTGGAGSYTYYTVGYAPVYSYGTYNVT